MLILNKDLLAWTKLVLRLVVLAVLGRLGNVWRSLLDALRPDGVDFSPRRLCLDSLVQVGIGLLLVSFLIACLLLDSFRVVRLLLDSFRVARLLDCVREGLLLTFVNFDLVALPLPVALRVADVLGSVEVPSSSSALTLLAFLTLPFGS